MIEYRIKMLRLAANYTAKDLSEYLGVTTKTYYLWENGKVAINSVAIIKLAQLYETSADYLLGLSNERRLLHEENILTNNVKKALTKVILK